MLQNIFGARIRLSFSLTALLLLVGCDFNRPGSGLGGSSGAGGSSSDAAAWAPSGSGGGSVDNGGSTSTAGASGSGDSLGVGSSTGIGVDGGATSVGGAAQDGGEDGQLPGDAGAGESRPSDAALYNPCPPKGQPCVVLPVGDSITAGSQSSTGGGYRLSLFHLAHMNTKSLTFVGANMSGPVTVDGVPFPKANSGYSGFEIDGYAGREGIAQFFPAQITKYKPHIILLMIGTNDVASGVPNIPPRLAQLMDTILNADPSLLLVVAQIVPQQKTTPDTQNMLVQEYNSTIPALVKERAAAGKHVRLVDMYGALTKIANYSTSYFANTMHPNDAGYEVMGETWYAAIGPLLR